MFFVIGKENQGAQRPEALTEAGTPDRDRQKLLREQYVLKEVGVAGLILPTKILCYTDVNSLLFALKAYLAPIKYDID